MRINFFLSQYFAPSHFLSQNDVKLFSMKIIFIFLWIQHSQMVCSIHSESETHLSQNENMLRATWYLWHAAQLSSQTRIYMNVYRNKCIGFYACMVELLYNFFLFIEREREKEENENNSFRWIKRIWQDNFIEKDCESENSRKTVNISVVASRRTMYAFYSIRKSLWCYIKCEERTYPFTIECHSYTSIFIVSVGSMLKKRWTFFDLYNVVE